MGWDLFGKDHSGDLRNAENDRRRERDSHSSTMSYARNRHDSAVRGHHNDRDTYDRWRREESNKFSEIEKKGQEARNQEEEQQYRNEKRTARENQEKQLEVEKRGNKEIENEKKSGTSSLNRIQDAHLTERGDLEEKRTRMVESGNKRTALIRGKKDRQKELEIAEEMEYGEKLLNQSKESSERLKLMQTEMTQELQDHQSQNCQQLDKNYQMKADFEVFKSDLLLARCHQGQQRMLACKESGIGEGWNKFSLELRRFSAKKEMKSKLEEEKWVKMLTHLGSVKSQLVESLRRSEYRNLIDIIEQISEILHTQNLWGNPKPLFGKVHELMKEFNEIWDNFGRSEQSSDGYLKALMNTPN